MQPTKKQNKGVSLIFPHQLHQPHPSLSPDRPVFLVEEWLFFTQYHFHKTKLVFHRATMREYKNHLLQLGYEVHYIECTHVHHDIRQLIPHLAKLGFSTLHFSDVTDNWLDKRIRETALQCQMEVEVTDSPLFLNSREELRQYHKRSKRFFQTDFYTWQRKYRHILIEADGKPIGGKWSFDADNRQRYPAKSKPPQLKFKTPNSFDLEATTYIQTHFPNNPGETSFYYPSTREEALHWMDDFFTTRFRDFGPYEDAIVSNETFLHHSVLSPLINIGLLSPQEVIDKALSLRDQIPLSSLEGFIRQIIGWREFIRYAYLALGSRQRTTHFWKFTNALPAGFYTATTGIPPIDAVISKTLRYAYNHHIERLMVLGNYLLLTSTNPDYVYRWFMEMYIDAYDWVMVPNIYGMSQFSDGGLMCTKPYISGSNYLRKMSDFPPGHWETHWTDLYWKFIDQHRSFFLSNTRLSMMVRLLDRRR